MDSRQPFLLGGEWRGSGRVSQVTAPYDGAVIAEVGLAGVDDAERAVGVAASALRPGLAPYRRAEILDEAARLLAQRREELAQLLSREVGKPITLARGEVDRAVDTVRFSAAVARTHAGGGVTMDAAASGVGKVAYTMARPMGVVVAITPFNFPLNLVAHKVAPAIAAGCPVVLKPADQAPLTALAFAQLLLEAGLPEEFLSVLPGNGPELGAVFTHDQRVAAITFTGSTRVGWLLREQAPRKKVLLELGNSAPAIVHSDADLDLAATKLTAGAFAYAGQSCVSVQRVYAHRRVVDELVERVLTATAAVGVGDPAQESTVVGPVIDDASCRRLTSWVSHAVEAGADLLTGGSASQRVFAPSVLREVPATAALEQQEAFGPVFGIAAYDQVEAAFARANDTSYGLQAAIFTADLRLAFDATSALEFGGVLVNEAPTFRTDAMPYGGGKDSGNTREGPASTVRELTEERLVVIDHAASPRASRA